MKNKPYVSTKIAPDAKHYYEIGWDGLTITLQLWEGTKCVDGVADV